jgi:hypothetical protein
VDAGFRSSGLSGPRREAFRGVIHPGRSALEAFAARRLLGASGTIESGEMCKAVSAPIVPCVSLRLILE